MRIAVSNTFARPRGGVESHLSLVIPALEKAGHEVAMLFELGTPAICRQLSNSGRSWCVSEIGVAGAVHELREWGPDVLYVQAVDDPRLERMILGTAPAVRFAHDYFAACISGRKAFAFPSWQVCSRAFGRRCLVSYFPRRCGGLSPIVMWKSYLKCKERLKLLQHYRHILVASEAMRLEYLRNGLRPDQVETLPFPIRGVAAMASDCETETNPGCSVGSRDSVQRIAPHHSLSHLLFAGRMVTSKGGDILLDALPHTAGELGRPLLLTMAGDGPARSEWEQRARDLSARDPSIQVEFTGWLGDAELRSLFEACDLLVVPSLWPEPFGLVGPEAGTSGLPAVAFDVGGISQWLHDGINGFLASGDPPTADGLATAIVKCLSDPSRYQQLRRGARAEAMKFGVDQHIQRLIKIFEGLG